MPEDPNAGGEPQAGDPPENEPTGEQGQQPPEPTGEPAKNGGGQEPTPPWGSDEEFNPDKAWRLIQNLRQEKEELKPLADKAKELEDSKKTDQQRLEEALETAKTEGSQATDQLLKLEVALDAAPEGVSPAEIRKLSKRLSGSTREELEQDASELFEMVAPAQGDGDSPLPSRPRPRLSGGADPSRDPEPDTKSVVDSIPPL